MEIVYIEYGSYTAERTCHLDIQEMNIKFKEQIDFKNLRLPNENDIKDFLAGNKTEYLDTRIHYKDDDSYDFTLGDFISDYINDMRGPDNADWELVDVDCQHEQAIRW